MANSEGVVAQRWWQAQRHGLFGMASQTGARFGKRSKLETKQCACPGRRAFVKRPDHSVPVAAC